MSVSDWFGGQKVAICREIRELIRCPGPGFYSGLDAPAAKPVQKLSTDSHLD